MAKTLFITGSTGFIGRALVKTLLQNEGFKIKALVRRPMRDECFPGGIAPEFVIGDLLEPAAYAESLFEADTVIHLAAVSGNASERAFKRVNVGGTHKLIEACKAANVKRLLHVSSIAAKYDDMRHYTYAKTKADAEALVRECGISFTIIRPTNVIATGSPNWRGLLKMASLPLIPLPDGGVVRIQPIHLDDLIRGLHLVLTENHFRGDTLELGGPAPILIGEYLSVIHRVVRGRNARFVPIPLEAVRAALSLVEPIIRPVLPITSGQLAVFANDGTIVPNWLQERIRPQMRSLTEEIRNIIGKQA
jgi:nucleoside-diphosphate-sugar epimerase